LKAVKSSYSLPISATTLGVLLHATLLCVTTSFLSVPNSGSRRMELSLLRVGFSVAFVDIYLAILVVNLYELTELPLLLKQVFHHT
jgi:hypothetical protein